MVVEKYGFGPNGSGSSLASDAAIIGEAYWGNIPDGTQVDLSLHQAQALERFAKAGITKVGIVPLMGPAAERVIKSFYNTPMFQWSREDVQEWINKAMEPVKKDTVEYLHKAYEAEFELNGEHLSKAETTSSSLMHAIADESVAYLYKAAYPMQTLLPVEANKGKTASWDSIGPYKFGSAGFGTEDPSLTESDITPTNRTDTVKYMYAVGRLTKAVKFAGLAQYPVRDIKAIRIDAAQDALRALRERRMLGVSSDITDTTNAFASAGSLEYKGLYELISANVNTYGDQCFVDCSALAVDTYSEIMTQLDASYRKMVKFNMQPNLAVCDYVTFGIIRRGLSEYFRYNAEMQELVPGVSKLSLTFPNSGGLPIMPHRFLPMSTGTNGTIMLLDRNLLARRTLWADTYEELANINTSEKFVISAAETLIDKSDVSGTQSLHGGLFSITI